MKEKLKNFFAEYAHKVTFTLCLVMFVECQILWAFSIPSPLLCAVSATLFSLLTVVIVHNRRNPVMYIAVSAVLIVTALVIYIKQLPVLAAAVRAIQCAVSGDSPSLPRMIFICCLMAAVLSVIVYSLSDFFWVRITATVVLMAILIYDGINSINPDVYAKIGSISIIISVVIEIVLKLRYRKTEVSINKSALTFMVPVVLIFSVVVSSLPSNEEPIKWTYVKRTISKIETALGNLSLNFKLWNETDDDEFTINMQGYSDDGARLSDNLLSGNGLAMKLSTMTYPKSAFYVIGTVCDEYDGESWHNADSDDASYDENYMDYCETLYAIQKSGLAGEEVAKFADITDITIEYSKLRTISIFHPLKSCYFYFDKASKYDISGENLVFSKAQGKGTTYRVRYVNVDYSSELFAEIARKGCTYSGYESISEISFKNIVVESPKNFTPMLKERAEYIRSNYTTLPDNISQRTRELAKEITKNCNNDYDKLRAIEAYLRTYTYSKTPGEIPEGTEAVDYFLFETKKGYCTYFATAMAILARCENIPTRFVQGFCYDGTDEPLAIKYNLHSNNAHAWTEAYIEGVGWIPFEPTSAYSEMRYGDWDKARLEAEKRMEDNTPEPYQNIDDSQLEEEVEEKSESKREVVKANLWIAVIALLSTVFIAVIFVIVYIIVHIKQLKKRYCNADETERFIICYELSVRILARLETVRDESETVLAFAQRVSEQAYYSAYPINDIATVYCAIHYGDKKADKASLDKAEKTLDYLFRLLRNQKGRKSRLGVILKYR